MLAEESASIRCFMSDPGKTIQFFLNPDRAIQVNVNPALAKLMSDQINLGTFAQILVYIWLLLL